ncbi:MAG: DUF1295 domain-containing protein [Clostridia bacterium]|nr:DUF1295 domain-containing protein [Clostridia bacterium]
MIIVAILSIAFVLRLLTLIFSIKNERRLKNEGAIEYGKKNSTVMAVLHTVIYLGTITYSALNKQQFDTVSFVGLLIWLFSFIMLILVIYQLREVWTVKLLIAKKHKINKSFFFKYIRHPNYFLNIIPELISITLISKFYMLFIVVFPVYLITLVLRITEEERVMKQNFAEF